MRTKACAEPEPAGNVWHLGQHAVGHRHAGGIRVHSGCCRGHPDIDFEAGDGGGVYELLGGRGQPLDPIADRLADGPRHATRAIVVEAPAQLDDEERVPVARRPHRVEVVLMSRSE